jgi:hypothetical protein
MIFRNGRHELLLFVGLVEEKKPQPGRKNKGKSKENIA